MIAFEWARRESATCVGKRLREALEAGIGHSASGELADRFTAARLQPWRDPRRARAWRAPRHQGLVALLCGHIDNLDEVCGELGCPIPADPLDADALSLIYARGLRRWSEAIDRRIVGEYAAITLDEECGVLRLARSPLRAPPLHYACPDERVLVSTLPRALLACGIEQRLDPVRLTDNLYFNQSDETRGWIEGVQRVPLGSTVVFTAAMRQARRYYDLHDLPETAAASPREHVEQARALLAEGTRKALAGFSRPAVMLSGGLDSSQVAAHALAHLPASVPLNAYTFVTEPGWREIAYPGLYADEKTPVEAFAAMHPRLVPHFIDNAQGGFTDHLEQMFFLTGSAPINLVNLWQYHRLWAAARADGCDVVLLGNMGNFTFSANGTRGFSEYFRRLRWVQLYRALRDNPDDSRPLWRRFISLSLLAQLPPGSWLAVQRLLGRDDPLAALTPLRTDYARSSGTLERAKRTNPMIAANSRRRERELLQNGGAGEESALLAGMELLHAIPQRDPTAYRPLVEFCLGLPTDRFLRDGQQRWLAREMARGLMPEAQRINPREGSHNADWHLKLGREREALLAETRRLAEVPRLAEMIDFPRIEAALETWPDETELDVAAVNARRAMVPRALTVARFISYIEGRNLR